MRKPGSLIQKDAQSDEPWGFDWTAYLLELGASVAIATSTWTVTGADAVLTKHNESVVTGDRKAQLYLAAGTVGLRYTVTNRIVTNSAPPVTDDRSFYVLVVNK